MKLKAATLVFVQNGNPFIVCDDPINLGDLTYSIEDREVGEYNNESYDKTYLRKVLATPDQIGWLVVGGIMQEIQRQYVDQMLNGQFSVEMTLNDEVKTFGNRVIIHK